MNMLTSPTDTCLTLQEMLCRRFFDFSPPAFQTTFDSKAPVWEFSIKVLANVPTADRETESPVASGSLDSIKYPAAQKALQAIHRRPL